MLLAAGPERRLSASEGDRVEPQRTELDERYSGLSNVGDRRRQFGKQCVARLSVTLRNLQPDRRDDQEEHENQDDTCEKVDHRMCEAAG